VPNVDHFIDSMSLKLGSKLGVQKFFGFFFQILGSSHWTLKSCLEIRLKQKSLKIDDKKKENPELLCILIFFYLHIPPDPLDFVQFSPFS
jgi:hypothetical protein